MLFILLLVLANIFVAGLAILGVSKGRRTGLGYVAGLSALVALPLADVSLLVFLFKGIPYFPLLTPAGVSLGLTGSVALIGALYSCIAALKSRR
jgi:hypothetical protein